ncbi:hypothetical protein [Thermogymnomonas acidicola]|uniref:hypothetical protein n=1 Tax=Thermogymnomonas acidicola TaxID=399579 RepID=UPI00094622BF|nr:hypothetical protein [Thermogymnomonas acidicola]
MLEEPIPERARIMGHVDGERRWYLSVHHSATHLLLGVLRKVLGEHVWQSGVQKNVESSRLDITHYSKITEEEIRRIEKECMRVIAEDRKIIVTNMEWNRACPSTGSGSLRAAYQRGPK